MNLFNVYSGAKHRIKVKLYPNYLPTVKGKYIARTVNESLLTVEQICETMFKRAGADGDCENAVRHVKQFFDETAYQLCDGFGINFGYFSLQPNICGTFDSVRETHDPQKNKLNFKYHDRKPLRDLVKNIVVEIVSLGDNNAFIDKFIDTEEEITNSQFVPGNMFVLTGSKIKSMGSDPNVGVFFVPVDAPSKAVKVKRLSENTASKITGIAPDTKYQYNRIEVRTQFTGSEKIQLKTPRIITSDFVLEVI